MAERSIPIQSGPAIPAEPYRNPELLLPMIQNLDRYDFYFVLTHGELLRNDEPYRFQTPADTIVIQTGGEESAGCFVLTSLDQYLFPRFQPNQIRQTFEILLGKQAYIRDDILIKMLFNTPSIGPTDFTLNKLISLSKKDLRSPGQLWGVYKLRPRSADENMIEYDKELTDFIIKTKGLTEEFFILYVRALRGTERPTLFFFLNCIVANTQFEAREFTESLKLATQPTHYARENNQARSAGVTRILGVPGRARRFAPVPAMTAEELEREVNLGEIVAPRAEEGNRSHHFNTLLEAAYPNSNTENKGCLGAFCRRLKRRWQGKKRTQGGNRKIKKDTTRKRFSK